MISVEGNTPVGSSVTVEQFDSWTIYIEIIKPCIIDLLYFSGLQSDDRFSVSFSTKHTRISLLVIIASERVHWVVVGEAHCSQLLTMEGSPLGSRLKQEPKISSLEWDLKGRISSKQNKRSRRYSGSYITTYREESNRSSRSNITTVSTSTASSPGCHLKCKCLPPSLESVFFIV